MNAVPFDILKLATALREASFSPEQAEGAARAIADAAQTELATRSDLEVLRRDVKAEISAVRAEVSAVRADLLRSQMTLVGVQTIVLLGAIVGAVVTLLRLH